MLSFLIVSFGACSTIQSLTYLKPTTSSAGYHLKVLILYKLKNEVLENKLFKLMFNIMLMFVWVIDPIDHIGYRFLFLWALPATSTE